MYVIECLVNSKIEDPLLEYLLIIAAMSTSSEDLKDNVKSNMNKRICAYFSEDDFSDKLIDKLKLFFKKCSISKADYNISFKPFDDSIDWMSEWKKHYKPIFIGKTLVILPSWEINTFDRTEIKIIPEMAFGTGDHPTTKMCLLALEEEVFKNDNKNLSVLDFGCGSGILGITAKKLGAAKVFGLDNDSVAIKNAKKNAYINNLNVPFGTKLTHFNYDIIVSNILAETHIELITSYKDNLKNAGKLILSGILDSKKDSVVCAFQRSGFSLLNNKSDGEWVCVIFLKGAD